MAETETLRNMILAFRVSELQLLLGFAGRNKLGKKIDLQQRALKLLKLRSTPVQMKIRELYKSIPHNGLNVSSETSPSTSHGYLNNLNNVQANPAAAQNQGPLDLSSAYKNYIPHPPWPYYQPPMQMINDLLSSPSAQEPLTTLHPDVKFKNLPFYEVLGELLKPTTLVPIGSQRFQENNFAFKLTEAQVNAINDLYDLRTDDNKADNVQVQIRFCVSDTTCEQDDCFPSGITVKLNGSICTLPNLIPTNKPGVEPKRPPRPVNCTMFIKLHADATNILNVSWNSEPGKGFCVVVYFVHKLSAEDLLQKLDVRGMREADYTCRLVKDKLEEDLACGISANSIRVSLGCPLLKRRIIAPCRPVSCTHVQCFDATTFLMMNEKKPSWLCPICDKKVSYRDLLIDEYFKNALTSSDLPSGVMEIQILENGSWSLLGSRKDEVKADSQPEESESHVGPIIHNVTSLVDPSIFGERDPLEQTCSTEEHDDEILVLTNGSNFNPPTAPGESSDKHESNSISAPPKIAVPPKKRKVCVVDLTSDSDGEAEDDSLVEVARKVSKLGTSLSKSSTFTSTSSSSVQPEFYEPAEIEPDKQPNNCEIEIDLTDD